MRINSAQWLVLDNLKNDWPYWTNLNKDIADKTYLWCVSNELIKDGRITAVGLSTLFANPNPMKEGTYE